MSYAALQEKYQAITSLKPSQFATWEVELSAEPNDEGKSVHVFKIVASRNGLYSMAAVPVDCNPQFILDRYVPKMDLAIRKAEEKAGVVQ